MSEQTQQLYNLFKSKGMKMTPARKNMVTVFRAAKNKLLDARQVYDLIKNTNPRINFSTVYRNLEMLVQNGIIEKINLEGKAVFALYAKQYHRHHMICTSCRKFMPLPFCPLTELENSLKKELNGFLPVEHKVEIYGYCAECRSADK